MTSPTKDRNGTYVLRHRVPKRFESFTSQAVIKRSLKTKDLAEAKRRQPETMAGILRELERLERQAQPESNLGTRGVGALCDRWLLEKLAEIEGSDGLLAAWATESIGVDESHLKANEAAAYNGYWAELQERAQETYEERKLIVGGELRGLIEANDLVVHDDSMLYKRLVGGLFERFRKLSASAYKRFNGDFTSQPEAPLAGVLVGSSSSAQGSVIRVSALVKRWEASVRAVAESGNGGLGKIDDYSSAYRRFTVFTKDADITGLTKRNIADFRDLLYTLPSSPAKALKALSLQEQAAVAKTKDLKCLSNNTVRNAIMHLRSLFTYAVDSGLMGVNVAVGAEPPRTKKRKVIDEKNYYSSCDLATIFALPVFTEGYRPPIADYGDAPYWVPLLCYYTGARLEEICQLYVSQVHADQETGVHYLRMDEGEVTQNVKSHARDVPVCEALLELGFLEYVDSLPRSGRLFPALKASGPKAKRGHDFGKWWGKYLRSATGQSFEDRQPSHAFRHTFETHARTANIRLDVAGMLTGRVSSRSVDGYGAYEGLKGLIDSLPTIPNQAQLVALKGARRGV